ncbi:hypothetical protein PRIPAC_97783 [Pristionchus pacificus]|uniref:Uncharacterized protein n=1 Tax=Pristionchus pacificus TaxID=54126 RepID=A0A2A6D1D1_PRIPA|nr:hypothetical protein PRIPAC_97783 [Pristionchus pacificus]|eukprot:PDM84101.1 hypothetical protein PRIPAC_34293 [Pristionchus pacificus]
MVLSSSVPLKTFCALHLCTPMKWKKVDVVLEVMENGERKNFTDSVDLIEVCEFDFGAQHVEQEKYKREQQLRKVQEQFDEFAQYRDKLTNNRPHQ